MRHGDFQTHPSDGEKFELLVSLLPEITCKDGCVACCEGDTVIITEHSGGPNKDHYGFKIVRYEKERHACSWFVNGACINYADRPFICRIAWKAKDGPSCLAGLRPKNALTNNELTEFMWCWEFGTVEDARALVAIK